MNQLDPIKFFSLLLWIDGRPLLDVIEPYRLKIFQAALYALYNLILTGRAKKCWKSTDLLLTALCFLIAWYSPLGNQCYLLGNDKGQAADNLELLKKIIRANPILMKDLIIKKDRIERRDGKGFLEILPAQDVAGAHGKTYLFCGFDEIHEYRDWGLFEAMALDPHRPDAMMWISSYASLYNYPGIPLCDLIQQVRRVKIKECISPGMQGTTALTRSMPLKRHRKSGRIHPPYRMATWNNRNGACPFIVTGAFT